MGKNHENRDYNDARGNFGACDTGEESGFGNRNGGWGGKQIGQCHAALGKANRVGR